MSESAFPLDLSGVVPSRVGVGESFALKVKVLGETQVVPPTNFPFRVEPWLHGPFNLAAARELTFLDNCLPAWRGVLHVDGGPALQGPARLVLDGLRQGTFPGDTRPIATFDGFSWNTPGFHFLRLIEPESGLERWLNPMYVTPEAPTERIFWGDPHWQTFFSDGVRCPEELYAFARDEGFLDFGAISDHMEALSDRQWEYFMAVTNDFNQEGRFVTLIGQEWTKSPPGHRNVYVPGDYAPILRSSDARCDSLPKLWKCLEGREALVIPHHSANQQIGVDWSHGWNPEFERAVEIYSVWGNSETSAEKGNLRPIRFMGGEAPGQHVLDALAAGYRFGFVAGGDIHDGRPGHCLAHLQSHAKDDRWPQGLTAAYAPRLTRANVYGAMRDHRTYATTLSRIYLDTELAPVPRPRLMIRAASENGISEVAVIRNGERTANLSPEGDTRIVTTEYALGDMAPEEYCYLRVTTTTGEMGWSSPFWGDEVQE